MQNLDNIVQENARTAEVIRHLRALTKKGSGASPPNTPHLEKPAVPVDPPGCPKQTVAGPDIHE